MTAPSALGAVVEIVARVLGEHQARHGFAHDDREVDCRCGELLGDGDTGVSFALAHCIAHQAEAVVAALRSAAGVHVDDLAEMFSDAAEPYVDEAHSPIWGDPLDHDWVRAEMRAVLDRLAIPGAPVPSAVEDEAVERAARAAWVKWSAEDSDEWPALQAWDREAWFDVARAALRAGNTL